MMQNSLSIVTVSTVLPRPCGIATFHHDVNFSLKQFNTEISSIAMQRGRKRYAYPAPVVSTIRQEVKSDYTKAAALINRRNPDVVLLQHEFGIFGGRHGDYVMLLLRRLKVPVVVVMHRYEMQQDSDVQRERTEVAQAVARHASSIIVISETARQKFITDLRTSGISTPVIHVPHGTPAAADYWLENPKRSVIGKDVPTLATFGLVGKRKGIQDVVEAMPSIVRQFPTVLYRVLGQTHPADVEARAFLQSLRQRVRQLGLENNVSFVTRFLSVQEIMENLQASDVYITYYGDPSQTSSGTLSFALAAGCCIVSTPYVHAQELLAHGRGVLVPFGNRKMLGRTVIDLLRDDQARSEYRRKALAFGRTTAWSLVGRSYLDVLLAAVKREKSRKRV